ncbi:metallophosphoesterase [uncultured Dokdonia sp.]|uniref:metallophosphoesterase family protein n=1 Tax=uncultured Dokdonia sp. TaxID=575653 RepID=UPI002611689A|nr:metallophosphoesterase [uncultured Dokdonia sp.]
MKHRILWSSFIALILVGSCKNNTETPIQETTEEELGVISKKQATPVFSFSFVGCNRIDRHNQSSSNPSTANVYALERIYQDMDSLSQKPELFFFLGDLVLAESTLPNLDSQLKAWEKLYDVNPISKSGIELVAVPGNHEMLSYTPNGEIPLAGSTDVWLKYMKKYMPTGRKTAPDTLGLDNRLTFAFTKHNVGFVVMNTDTYNPNGLEGQLPVSWVNNQVEAYKKDSAIDHIFVLGHRPYYVNGQPDTTHGGLPQGGQLWPTFEKNGVVAMLSAHQHNYERSQPINNTLGGGTYQIVAGHGGSVNNRHVSHSPPFFGYSLITVMSDGSVELDTRGYCTGDTYLTPVSSNPMTSRDKTTLTWAKNPNTFTNPYTGCQ